MSIYFASSSLFRSALGKDCLSSPFLHFPLQPLHPFLSSLFWPVSKKRAKESKGGGGVPVVTPPTFYLTSTLSKKKRRAFLFLPHVSNHDEKAKKNPPKVTRKMTNIFLNSSGFVSWTLLNWQVVIFLLISCASFFSHGKTSFSTFSSVRPANEGRCERKKEKAPLSFSRESEKVKYN